MSHMEVQRVDEVRQQGARAVAVEFLRELVDVRHQSWGNLWGYVFIAPAVLMYLVFQAWPILRGLFMAFSDYRWLVRDTHGLAGFNGLANWNEMFGDATFWSSFGIALRFSLMVLPPDTYDHRQGGRLYWHNEMLVKEMGAMLDGLRRLVEEEEPDRVVFLGDLVNTNWAANVADVAARLREFPVPMEVVTGNHDVYLGAAECRLQESLAPGEYETGLRCRLQDGWGLIFLDGFVRYGQGEFRKWLDLGVETAGVGYRPQDVKEALGIMDAHPDTAFLLCGHFPFCDPETWLRQAGRAVGRGQPEAAQQCQKLWAPGNLVGAIAGHQHFAHLQMGADGFHWTLPSLVEYPCAAALVEMDDGMVRGRTLSPVPSLARGRCR